jgi:hypothetical protein
VNGVCQPQGQMAPTSGIGQALRQQPSLDDITTKGARAAISTSGPSPRTTEIFSVWADSFADYEYHDNLAPGQVYNPSRTQKSGGITAGADWTYVQNGPTTEGVTVGVLGGYSDSYTRNNPASFSTTFQFFSENVSVLRSTSNTDGGSAGAFVSYFRGPLSVDALFKADIMDLSESNVRRVTIAGFGGCGPSFIPSTTLTSLFGSTSTNAYTTAANANYRIEIMGNQ